MDSSLNCRHSEPVSHGLAGINQPYRPAAFGADPPSPIATFFLFNGHIWAKYNSQLLFEKFVVEIAVVLVRVGFNFSFCELRQILGYTQRVISIADKRKHSDFVTFSERLRQHACSMHNVLLRNWEWCKRSYRIHYASSCLRAETKTISLNVLFVVRDEQGPSSNPTKEEVTIEPVKEAAASPVPANQLAYLKQAERISVVPRALPSCAFAEGVYLL